MKKNRIKFFITIFLIVCMLSMNTIQLVAYANIQEDTKQTTNVEEEKEENKNENIDTAGPTEEKTITKAEESEPKEEEKQQNTTEEENKPESMTEPENNVQSEDVIQQEEMTKNEDKVEENLDTQVNILSTPNEITGTKTIENGTYTISSAMNSNLVLDVAWSSMSDGANIALYQKNGQNNQKFNITYLENGYYKMEVVTSGKYLSGTNEKGKNEDNVIQKTYDEEKDIQKWIIKDAGDGYYYIISKDSSLYLDVYREQAQSGANIILYEGKGGTNQKFKFNKVNTISSSKTIDDGIYTISTALDFNQVLDVNNASNANSANVEIYTRNTGKNQQFKVEYLDNGYYTIQAIHSEKYLTVKDASVVKGANVEQYANLGTDAQKWVIRSAGNGYYYIISKCNNLYLDLQGGGSSSGTNIEVYEPNYQNWQKFKFYSVEIDAQKTVEPGNYVITSALNTNKVIDVEGDVITDQTNIEIWSNNNGNNQKFIVSYLEDGYYTIKAFNSNKVLTIVGASALSGANVVQSYYNGSDAQKWAIQSAGDGYYYFVSKYSHMVLDIQGATSTNGSNVEVYEKNGGKNQKFKLVKTEFSATIADGKYAILASSNTNKALDIANSSLEDGAEVKLWESNGGNNQSFYIEYVGDGCYTIQVASSQKLLTAKDGKVVQQEADESDAQKWIIQKADNSNHYAIRSKESDKYLDIYYNLMQDGTKIQVYPGNEENSQRFQLEELNYKGIDVAKYQGKIDWSQVRSQIDFAMIRVGNRYWGSGEIAQDPYYTQNITEALKNNIDCGVYFYSQAINEEEAIEEANFVLDSIKGYDLTYPVAVDTELTSSAQDGRADNLSKEERTKVIKTFCQTIEEAGYTPIIYAGKDWLNNQLDMDELKEYDVWLAHYVKGAPENTSDYEGEYTIWQYSSTGKINGINGNVDMNICYKKYN